MSHEFQHPNSPTWCIHCGVFDCYARGTKCSAEDRAGKFNTEVPANFVRIFEDIFGKDAR